MSDNDQQAAVDLFEGNVAPDTSADAGATDGNAELAVSEEPQIATPEKEKTTTSKAEVERQKQVDAWVAKGRAALETLPKDKEWLRPHIEAKLKAQDREPEIDKLIDERMAKKEAKADYDAKIALINSMSLSRDQRDLLNEEFNDNKALGLADNKALEKAMKVARIPIDSEEQNRLVMRKRMAIPQGSGRGISDENVKPDDPDFHKKVTNPKDKMRILMESMRAAN